MKLSIFGVLCASLCINAFAAEGKWTEGFGQGNLEYFIDAKGVRLYIACPTKDGSEDTMSSVSLTRLSDSQDANAFSIAVNGMTFDGPFDADSRVGSDNFRALLDGLRKVDAIVKVGKASITFPKSNAAKVIPSGKKFNCNVSF